MKFHFRKIIFCTVLLGLSASGYAMEKPNVVLMAVTKWLHEYDSENRFDGDHDFFLCMMSL